VEAAAAPKAARRIALPLSLRKRPQTHVLVLVGGALLIALAAALVAVKVTVLALDETLMQQSAVHYASGLPNTLLHDVDARATNRLYSLVLSIAYRITGGPDAIRIDRVLTVLMFVSAVFPIYLMARRLLASRGAAVAVALLSVLAPWLTLTTALFTENLSYPLFWWALLACCVAIERPAPARDLLALVVIALLVGTRVQFAAVLLGYVLCLLVACAVRSQLAASDVADGGLARLRRRLAVAARLAIRSFPVTVAIVIVVIVGLVYARASGQWEAHVSRLLGTYSDVVTRSGLPPNMAEGVLIEVIALGLGVGLLPALVSVPWYARALSRPRLEPRWATLAVCGAILVVFLLATVYSQGGYLGEVTEERYFFYIVPVFWIGAFAAVTERSIRAGEVLACAVAFAALYASIPFVSPLSSETAFLAPVESTVPHIVQQRLAELGLTGTTVQDVLFVLVLAAGAVTAWLWRRPLAAKRWVIGGAVVVQLLILGYAYAVIDGHVQGVPGRTGGSYGALGWVDAAAGGHEVAWLDNENVDAPPAVFAPQAGLAANQTHVTLFYNSQLRSWVQFPATALPPVEFPLTGLPGQPALEVAPSSGAVRPAAATAGLTEVVGQADSPFLQLAGGVLARSPDEFLTLTRLERPLRASWLAEGLGPDGAVSAGPPARLHAFTRAGEGLAVTLTLGALPVAVAHQPATELRLKLGPERRAVRLPAGGAPQRVTIADCPAGGARSVAGSVTAVRTFALQGRVLGGMLLAAAVSEQPCPAAQG
jgi:hypothetical protein